jgi:hypothetical protein
MICGPCRVPLGSGIGKAKVTLSYPGWKVGEVKPVTIEIPIGPISWQGLFFNYLVCPLGAAVLAATGWVVWRTWRYIAKRRRRLQTAAAAGESGPAAPA